MAKGVFNASVFTGRPLYPSSVSTLVTVYDADTGLPVPTLWLDRDGAEELSNPHALSEEGVILFYANPGRYNIEVSLGVSLLREWPDVIISDAATSGGGGSESIVAGTYITVDDTDPLNPIVSSTGGSAVWGGITGTLSDQTDLQAVLDAKAALVQTDGIAGYIGTVANTDYRIAIQMPFAGTILSTTTQSVSGTCTATFKINTTALGGTANSVSSSEQEQTHSGSNTFSAGDNLVMTTSSNSSCLGLSFMVKFTRSLSA
jgi:hypothetical protein